MDPNSQNQPQYAPTPQQQPMPQAAAQPYPEYQQPQTNQNYPPQQPTAPQGQLPPVYTQPQPTQQSQPPYPQQAAPPLAQQPVMPQQPQPSVVSAAALSHPTPPPANKNSTQNSLEIAEIRDGIVIMNDGSFRAVVMVKSINFDLMSPTERESVEFSYQGFLNSLYFPIQIFIRSQKVDLRPYIEKLDKIRAEHDNMLLAMLMEDYILYIDQLSAQTNIMDKKFYVVIPFFPRPDAQKAIMQSANFFTGIVNIFSKTEQKVVINEADLNKAKDELRNRVQSVLGGLAQSGIQGLPLDTQELIELYYDTYNPDTATRQQLKNFNNMTADIVTKGEGNAVQANLDREIQ